jgi:release factor glutamine methyltransferase
MSTSIAETIRRGRQKLAAAGIDTPRLDAEILLRHVLDLDRAQLFAHLHEPVSDGASSNYQALITARADGIPVAYLTGEREFYGLTLATRPGVLIPRPETELLVEWALTWLARRPGATVVDVGTGTGAIPLALATTLGPDWIGTIIGSDRFLAPVVLASENRTRLNLAGRVSLVRGSLLGWCAGPVDLITANLPYLRPDQVASNPMLAAEPVDALVAGPDGLDLIRELIVDLPRVLRSDGAVILEIDASQAAAVRKLLEVALPRALVSVLPDLSGQARFVTADLSLGQ